MLLAIAPFVWISISHPHYLQNLNQIISQNKLFFICLRWLLILTIFCTWPRFIRYRAKQHYWKPEKTMFWLNQRLKITLWLVIFELVVCENLFLTLIHTLEGH
ncbi:MAG TPA: hypothetical protein VHA13_00725, partial [Gammaproteobacteria bacterium]|nr:hypothetical protein [Gammaproteobacteria bacterium]